MNASHSINLFTNSCYHISTNGKAPPHLHKNCIIVINLGTKQLAMASTLPCKTILKSFYFTQQLANAVLMYIGQNLDSKGSEASTWLKGKEHLHADEV